MRDLKDIVDILRELEQILGFKTNIELEKYVSKEWKFCKVRNSGLVIYLWCEELYRFLTGEPYSGDDLFFDLSRVLGFKSEAFSFTGFVYGLVFYLGGKE
jgi:hypothetical protein